jgi:hypothetical protein
MVAESAEGAPPFTAMGKLDQAFYADHQVTGNHA